MPESDSKSILLNAATVKYLISRSGLGQKNILPRDARTVRRILKTGRTSPATAQLLAEKLNVTVEDLQADVPGEDWGKVVPELWFYEDLWDAARAGKWRPFGICSGDINRFILDARPTSILCPLTRSLEYQGNRQREIILRRKQHAFELEVHHYDEIPTNGQPDIRSMIGCRFFPMTRNGDTLACSAMTPAMNEFVWTELQLWALENSEILTIEGVCEVRHPDDYKVLASFYEGEPGRNQLVGRRLFKHMNGDFLRSLADYIESLETTYEIGARSFGLGVEIEVRPPARQYAEPGWQQRYKTIHVCLLQQTASGHLMIAPWRQSHRARFAKGVTARRWIECHHPGHAWHWPEENDPDDPPFSADPDWERAGPQTIYGPSRKDAWLALWD